MQEDDGSSVDLLRIKGYRIGKTLGVGTFGKVKLAEHIMTGRKVAIKILNLTRIKVLRMDQKIRREIQVLRLFRHAHIIKLYEVIETASDIFMVMEYVSGGELFDLIVRSGKLKEESARRFFQQIVSAVEYCHNHLVVHRDLKPENILLDAANNVKIADFGLSNIMRDGDMLLTSCGSPNYAAPEVISGRYYSGQEIDVWSCGVILYALVCGSLPFDEEYVPTLFQKIRTGDFKMPNYLSAELQDLIRKLLTVNPLERITLPEVRAHPWFKRDLPRYLQLETSMSVGSRTIINLRPDLVSKLADRMSMEESQVTTIIKEGERTGKVNDVIIAYYLLEDNQPLFEQEEEEDKEDAAANAARMMSVSPVVSLREHADFLSTSVDSLHPFRAFSMPGTATKARSFRPQLLTGSFSLNKARADAKAAGLPQPTALTPAALGPKDGNEAASAAAAAAATLAGGPSPMIAGAGATPGTSPGLIGSMPTKVAPSSDASRWCLGLLSAKAPSAIMANVYKTLKVLNLEWKQKGPHGLICRRKQALLPRPSATVT